MTGRSILEQRTFALAGVAQAARIVEATSQKAPAADPNEIDLDDDDSDDDGEQVLSTKPVPAAVFGSAAAQAAEMSEPQGALARFQKKAS